MYDFHARILARRTGAGRAGAVRQGARQTPTGAACTEPAPLPVSFEEASTAFGGLPRMLVEPDGAWVWVGDGWQLDGVLVDRGGRLLYAEVKGSCPGAEFDRLLGCLGWPAAALEFEMVREGVRMEEEEFRGYVGRRESGNA